MPEPLNKISSIAALKALSIDDLEPLAEAIRAEIVDVVSRNGGHLASSLGSVELAIALCYLYDLPRDKIVWDVGHQAYAYKLLTGRWERFPTLRKKGGVSGFPSHKESEYDSFTVGHSGNAVSLALGLAYGAKGRVISVIGDGSLNNGMCFEALNAAGHTKADILVVLNTNNMAISPVEGALSGYVNRIITSYTYNKVHETVKDLLFKLPNLGKRLAKFGARIEEALKGVVVPGWLFEELGFKYYGPIDGHNVREMILILRKLMDRPGPKLLHIITQKGKGYRPAEENPTLYHSIGPFDVATGAPKAKKSATFTSCFREKIVEVAKREEKLLALTAAMLDGTGLDRLAEWDKSRVADVGIAEEHLVSYAGGLARGGRLPVVAIYSPFLQRAFDQMISDVAAQDVGVFFAIDRAGLVGEDGLMHHGLFDIAMVRSIPKMVASAPRDGCMLKVLMDFGMDIVRSGRPFSMRYPKAALPEDAGIGGQEVGLPIELGRGEVLLEGKDVALLCLGPVAYHAIECIKRHQLGYKVIDGVFIKPIDVEWLLKNTEDCGIVVTIEEGLINGGWGESIARLLNPYGKRVYCHGIADTFIGHASRAELLADMGLDSDGIYGLLQRVVGG